MENDEDLMEVMSIIEEIERKYVDLEQSLSNLPIASRDAILEEIYKDIILNNPVIKNFGTSKDQICIEGGDTKAKKLDNFIQSTIDNIKANRIKKVFYLRKFLDGFVDISESDKNVVIKSLKNTDIVQLRERLESLTRIFKIENVD
ncbi:MAG: hypothetical protein BAJALOKI3v1_480003 [Promethearchaeota archaeon]|jgi:hypothetical protein|nr:MAG: hypothetical protein BAJALOKI3v1_480003 [Candidatus Lokiarchaeota archaeon]